MKANIRVCVERHLVEKARGGNVVPPGDWFDAAETHLVSVAKILNDDPTGATNLVWSAMHKIAKGLVTIEGMRLQDETHGKIVDFLLCVFDDLTDKERGIVRAIQQGRNAGAYDNPTLSNPALAAAFNLARKMLTEARSYIENSSK